MPYFDYQGTSGAIYRFAIFDMDNPVTIPWQGGVYIFAAYVPEPDFIGEGASLNQAIRHSAEWREVGKGLNRTALAYLYFEPDAQKRGDVAADLIANYRPRLNRLAP